jgi:hypothetical protein
MIINHNMSALYANRLVKFEEWNLNKDIEKLSSGQRINRGGDDASGLAVSEKLRSQIRGLNQAGRNIENGISFIQVAEGYLSESQDINTASGSWPCSRRTASTPTRIACRSRWRCHNSSTRSTGSPRTHSSME